MGFIFDLDAIASSMLLLLLEYSKKIESARGY